MHHEKSTCHSGPCFSHDHTVLFSKAGEISDAPMMQDTDAKLASSAEQAHAAHATVAARRKRNEAQISLSDTPAGEPVLRDYVPILGNPSRQHQLAATGGSSMAAPRRRARSRLFSTSRAPSNKPSQAPPPWDMRPLAQMLHSGIRSHSELIPRLLQLRLTTMLMLGLVATFVTNFLFGAFYLACGEHCFALVSGKPFSYLEMVWLSVHTFTSVGFGSAYPTCHSAQTLVLIEYYVSLVLSAVVVALFLFKFLQPYACWTHHSGLCERRV